MDSTKRLGIAVVGLAVVSGLVFQQSRKDDAEQQEHTLEAMQSELPAISIEEEASKAIDSITITTPPEVDEEGNPKEPGANAVTVTLSKTGEDAWSVKEPVAYPANVNNVQSLLKNLNTLKVTEQVSTLNDTHDKFGLTDEKAVHAVFKKGEETLLDAYFGETGSRGQMTRLAGKDGVFAVKGFSKYLYAREVNAWRDKTLFSFDEKNATKVTIKNETGLFLFEKGEKEWGGTLDAKPIERFKASKVGDLVRAYKGLNASDFGDGKAAEAVGLAPAKATLTIELKDGAGKYELLVGDPTEQNGRWVQASGKEGIFSVSSWAAEWATADASKFQEKAADEKAAEPDQLPKGLNPHSMPVSGTSP